MPSHRPRADFSFMARYGRTISRAGIAAIPTALFYYQAELRLGPELLWFVSTLLSYRWTDDLPYPSLRKISERSGVSLRSLHRYKDALVAASWRGQPYLDVIPRRRPNGGITSSAYDLQGLFAALEELITRDQDLWFKGPLVGDPLNDTLGAGEGSAPSVLPPGLNGAGDIHTPYAACDTGHGLRAGTRGSAKGDTGGNAPADSRAGVAAGTSPVSPVASHEIDTSHKDSGDRDPRRVEDTASEDDEGEQDSGSKADASTARPRGRTRGVDGLGLPPDSAWIDEVVADLTRDLHDDLANVRRNQNQARRIWQESGFSEERFVDRLGKAKRKAQAGRVTKQSRDGSGLPNRMPYFFKVLRDITGVD